MPSERQEERHVGRIKEERAERGNRIDLDEALVFLCLLISLAAGHWFIRRLCLTCSLCPFPLLFGLPFTLDLFRFFVGTGFPRRTSLGCTPCFGS